MTDGPIQLYGDRAEIGPDAELTDAPTRAGQVPRTGAGGAIRVPSMSVGSPESLTVNAAAMAVAANIEGSSGVGGAAVQSHNSNIEAQFVGARAQGTPTVPAIVDVADVIRRDWALAFDGVDYGIVGYSQFSMDGTPGSNDTPGRWDLFLTPVGFSSPNLVMSVRQDKTVTLYGALTVTGATTVAATQRLVSCLTETVTAASLTDGGAAVGTKVLTGTIPVGARIIGADVTVEAGFAGDVSATIKIGDGSDDDRYHTGAPSIFATAAAGIAIGIPSGAVNVLVANTPTVTITSNADITPVLAGGGSLTIRIYYVPRS